MKLNLDKNFFIVHFVLVIVFYLINSLLLCEQPDKKQTHFSKGASSTQKISSNELIVYVLSQQFGVPGALLTPVSNEAIFVSTIQRVIFVAYACAGLAFSKDTSNYNLFS